MVAEKRYFRSDDALGTVDSASETFTSEGVGNNGSFDIGIRVYVDAVEVTAGTPVGIANVAKGASAHVTATSTWNKVSNDAMSGSKVHVDVYGKLHGDADWTPERYFETEVLATATQLDAALWSLSYHVERTRYSTTHYGYEFAYGESNSWIDNFTWSTGNVTIPVVMHHYNQMTKIHRG